MADNSDCIPSSSPAPNEPKSTKVETRSQSRWPITRPNGLPPLHVDLSKVSHLWIASDIRRAKSMKRITQGVQDNSDLAVKNMGRPFRQEEAQASADHFVNGLNTNYYGTPAALAVTLLLSWRGRRTFRFPFYTPKWTNRSPDRFLFLRNGMSRTSWHTLRGASYLMTGGLATKVAVLVYCGAVGGMGQLHDPRLKDFHSSLRENPDALLSDLDHKISKMTERQSDGPSERARQQRFIQREDGESTGGNGGVKSSLDDDYHDPYQQTDKKALLEAIRRADGKSD